MNKKERNKKMIKEIETVFNMITRIVSHIVFMGVIGFNIFLYSVIVFKLNLDPLLFVLLTGHLVLFSLIFTSSVDILKKEDK